MNSKQSLSRRYDDVDIDDDSNATDIDIDIGLDLDLDVEIASDEKYEDETISSCTSEISPGAAPHFIQTFRGCYGNRSVIRCFPLLLTLVIGALLSLAWSLSPSTLSTTSDGNSREADYFPTTNSTSVETTSQPDSKSIPTTSHPQPSHSHSPFFENVLEWKQIPAIEALPKSYEINGTSSTTHFKASIEFCSDPGNELYGYGPVGNCVPGRAAPLIRMQPKRYVRCILLCSVCYSLKHRIQSFCFIPCPKILGHFPVLRHTDFTA